MADLLCAQEYAALAAQLKFPTQAFIDGTFQPSASGETFKTTNPATDEVLAEIAACNAADVDRAVASARAAYKDGRWRTLPPSRRKSILLKFADLLEANAHELATMESLDSGKPIRDCEAIDLPETIRTIKWHARRHDDEKISPAV